MEIIFRSTSLAGAPALIATVAFTTADDGRESATDLTGSMAGGVRVPLAAGWAIGGELRIRAIDPFHGTTGDWGLIRSDRM
jgi:hypothetical protein